MFHIKGIVTVLIILEATLSCLTGVLGQLPDDIQRELNQNLAEQARIQAMRQRHQQQIANRASGGQAKNNQQPSQPPHDPNNYSYQQVSPPIQYSYYQPYGDAAVQPNNGQDQQQTPGIGGKQPAGAPPVNFDLNNLNFDMPQAQAQAQTASPQQQQQQHYTPSFTGAGGLPVLKPIANVADNSYAPAGNAPLAPQARVQQGPPLSEADFRDITGGENYGAPGESDFGLGAASGGNNVNRRNSNSGADTDAQLREFGLPGGAIEQNTAGSQDRRSDNSQQMNIPDFGAFGPIGGSGGQAQRQSQPRADEFGLENLANEGGMQGNLNRNNGGGSSSGTDFDFAGQPSSRGEQAANTNTVNAPNSLQSLLGAGFPGLVGNAQSGLDDFARGGNNPQLSGQNGQQRADDGALDIANLGDRSDQFSGADLGGFEQPTPQNDQDFNYASSSNQQPKTVPYPDSNPQPVGTLWALTQPQSLSQTRYNIQVDRGTYQDYPAYQGPGNNFEAVREVVDNTPRARAAGPGRYGTPSPNDLAPENRPSNAGEQYDYSRGPNMDSNEEESGYEGYD